MEYKLGVHDRFMLLGLLPIKSTLDTIRIVHDLRMALAPSEAELEDLQLVTADGQTSWNPKAAAAIGVRGFEIGAKGQEIFRAALKKLEDDKKLREGHLGVIDLLEYES